jgi:hypothetical protein
MAVKVSKIISINELSNNEPSAQSLVLLRKNDVDGYSTIQQLEDYFAFVKLSDYQQKVAELEAADTQLQNIVANEVSTQLSSEITDRQAADTALQNSISTLGTTVTANSNAITSLQTNLVAASTNIDWSTALPSVSTSGQLNIEVATDNINFSTLFSNS